MEKPEIVGGIKNALEKGYSIEAAKRSFLNAGYNPKDVEDSGMALLGSLQNKPVMYNPLQKPRVLAAPLAPTAPVTSSNSQNQQQAPQQKSQQQIPPLTPYQQPQAFQPNFQPPQIYQPKIERPKRKTGLIIITIILALILLGLIGFLVALIFAKEQVLTLIGLA